MAPFENSIVCRFHSSVSKRRTALAFTRGMALFMATLPTRVAAASPRNMRRLLTMWQPSVRNRQNTRSTSPIRPCSTMCRFIRCRGSRQYCSATSSLTPLRSTASMRTSQSGSVCARGVSTMMLMPRSAR